MAGKPPSPRAGCAAALSGHRLYLYGGESDATGPPLDDLCCLDLEGASWQQLIGRGMSPGRLSFAAAASIGNKVYLFGGCTGEGVTNSFHSLDVVSTMWDPIESLTSQPPSPRMGHSMVAVCSQLLVYGGKDKATGKVFAGLAVFDTQGEHWSTLQARPHPVSGVTCFLALARSPPTRQATGARRHPAQASHQVSPAANFCPFTNLQVRGDIPRERWGHSSFMWGRQLVLGLGCDEGSENNAVNMLNLDTLTWESYDGNQARVGGAMGLLEGKLFLVGGQDGDARSNDVLQFNLGRFLMQFDGVDDEIMARAHPT